MDKRTPISKHQHIHDKLQNTTLFKIRNILNIIFMLGAIAGVTIYVSTSHTMGGYVIIGSIGFKFAECILRLLH